VPPPSRSLRDRLDPLWSLAAAAWVAAVLIVNSTPDSDLPKPRGFSLPEGADKVAHFFMYGIMAVLFWNALIPARVPRGFRAPWRIAVLLPCAIGLFDEIHQRTVPGRSSDPADLLADCLGAAVMVYLGTRKRPPVNPPASS